MWATADSHHSRRRLFLLSPDVAPECSQHRAPGDPPITGLGVQGQLFAITHHRAGATQLEMEALRDPSNDTALRGKHPSPTPVRPGSTSSDSTGLG